MAFLKQLKIVPTKIKAYFSSQSNTQNSIFQKMHVLFLKMTYLYLSHTRGAYVADMKYVSRSKNKICDYIICKQKNQIFIYRVDL